MTNERGHGLPAWVFARAKDTCKQFGRVKRDNNMLILQVMRFSLNQYPRLTLLPGGPVKSSETGWWVCTPADDLSTAVRTWGSLKRTILLLHKALSVRTFIRIKQMNRQALHANEWQAIFHLFYLHIMLLTLEKVGIRLDLSVRLPDGSAQEKLVIEADGCRGGGLNLEINSFKHCTSFLERWQGEWKWAVWI